MKTTAYKQPWILLALCTIILGSGCDHLNELDGVALNMDREVDQFSLSSDCTTADLSFLIPRGGIIDITGTDSQRAYAVTLSGSGLYYNGTIWEKSSWTAWTETRRTFLGLARSSGGNELLVVGSATHDPPITAAFFEYRHLDGDYPDGISGGGGGEGMMPEGISTSLDPQYQASAWYAAAFGPSYKDYILAGGQATSPSVETQYGPNLGEHLRDVRTSSGYLTRCHDLSCKAHQGTPDVPLSDAWGSSTGDFYVVGNRVDHGETCQVVTGEIYHCNRAACLLEATVTGAFLISIHGNSNAEVFVVGGRPANGNAAGGAIILSRKNEQWTEIPSSLNAPLWDVWGSENNLFLVGGHHPREGPVTSVALRFDGADYEVITAGADLPLYAVWGTSNDDVHLGGEGGLFHYPGGAATVSPSAELETMCQDYCAMEADCIPGCLCEDESCACADGGAIQECRNDCPNWAQRFLADKNCAPGFTAWMQCINLSTCDDAQTFFRGHPDGLNSADPCALQYFAMDCLDFEPRTEYGF